MTRQYYNGWTEEKVDKYADDHISVKSTWSGFKTPTGDGYIIHYADGSAYMSVSEYNGEQEVKRTNCIDGQIARITIWS